MGLNINYIRGQVTRIYDTYGFISGDNGVSYFFMPSGLQRVSRPFDTLVSGDRVEFIPITHPKGPRAIEVLAVRNAVEVDQ